MIYRPREDSYLLREFIESRDLEGKKVLDMGTGTGILAVAAAKNGAEVVAADINPEAIKTAEEKAREENVAEKIHFVDSDLFESIDSGFDLIVFNPPYLPGEEYKELQGGETGVELTERFLEDVENYLYEEGSAVFIASSRSNTDVLKQRFDLELLESEKLWFETLYLFRNK